jgi:predicted SnoaL-like aldol condensation-catalyzing enzyme
MLTTRADKLNTITMQEDTIMTNKEKALALINTFASGDTEKAKELLAPGYIQHNLAYGTGAEAFVGSVAYLHPLP